MLMTTRKPATVGEILREEFMEPMGLTQGALAHAMGVARKHVNAWRIDLFSPPLSTAHFDPIWK